ncbi:MAG: glycine zipper 2TM domain-containing protein [Sphingomonas sp.]|uniref:glycine zipper 2TM domain-containing protein n=1 Tax=Sphingomonas sp. TaxID=28214 RepID=UPI001B1863B1|nr:glycine zipper 2TM domain-containing protein [Sphingomonas sp.]MBO9623511.1 glycine zipper 2TM domain-containing protein [Sphingomonas sp.]
MRNLFLTAAAISLAIPTVAALPAAKAEAKSYSSYKDSDQRRRHRQYAYREWRGRDGRMYCRKPDGTTGLIVGGVAGALVGRTIDTRGDRAAGTVLGAVVGGLAGRELERSDRGGRRCR